MTVFDTRWHLLSNDVFLINVVFCWHNIAGKKCILMNRWRCLLISGGNYWFAMLFTNPRWYLPLRGCQLLIWGKNCKKQTQKRSQTNFLLHVYQGTMTQLFTGIFSPIHNPFNAPPPPPYSYLAVINRYQSQAASRVITQYYLTRRLVNFKIHWKNL